MLNASVALGNAALSKWPAVGLLCLCVVSAMSPWFAASAVEPLLRSRYHLSDSSTALLTSVVSIGFVVGTLSIAFVGLADRFDPRRVFRWSAALGGIVSVAALAYEPGSLSLVLLRFASGICMAGIYPLGMKIVSSWVDRDMGLLVGLVTASVTLGSAAPYLFATAGGVDWHRTLLSVGCASFAAALLISRVALGPRHGLNARFVMSQAYAAWKIKSLRLANLGYFGHKWENYAMWAGIGAFLQASLSTRSGTSIEDARFFGNLAAFAVVASGSVGCLVGGVVADRIGRTRVAIGALAVSAACCLCVGFLFQANFALLLALCLVWGFAIVADSGQFSSCVIELSDASLAGTLLTVQTCIGFIITLPAIQLVAYMSQHFGWQYAFLVLAIGPLLGIIAMARLRVHPDAAKRLGNGMR